MALYQELDNLCDSISATIAKLIKERGVECDDSSEKVLDMRMFHLDQNGEYRIELLGANNDPITYITPSISYDDQGNCSTLSVINNGELDDLCRALDTLVRASSPAESSLDDESETQGEDEIKEYNVVLRATVNIDRAEFEKDEEFSFPTPWIVYDNSGGDELTIRLDCLAVSCAKNREEAAQNAIDTPPSLNLDGFDCTIQHWVDLDQEDNVEQVS